MKLYLILLLNILAVIFIIESCMPMPAAKLTPEGEKPACMTCHSGFLDKKHVHAPVKIGACDKCHVAKTSIHPNEDTLDFETDGKELCFSCHRNIKAQMEFAKVQHLPFKEGICIICHVTHSSDFPWLLKAPPGKMCYSCHTELAKRIAASKSVHTPVKQGDCSFCHDTHGNDNAKILKNPFPEKSYTVKAENFVLCFDCHNEELATESNTATLTNFRNGDKNLHYNHINNAPKVQGCKDCHDIHVGDAPMNIRVKFIKTETGGSCDVECHKQQKSYDRINPVVR